MSDDVAAFLAQRKAKKQSGGPKFKTFTAANFIATDGEGEGELGSGGDRRANGACTLSGVASKALAEGEWVDEEDPVDTQRLVMSEIVDLEKLALDEKEKKEKEEVKKSAYPVRQPPPELAADSSSMMRPSMNRRDKMDFPALGAAASTPAAGPPSVWGSSSRPSAAVPQISPREDQFNGSASSVDAKPNVWRPKSLGGNSVPAPTREASPPVSSSAEEPKSNVWRPKSHISATQPSSNTPSNQPAPPRQAAAAPQPEAADGLRKSAQPWRPSHLRGGDQ